MTTAASVSRSIFGSKYLTGLSNSQDLPRTAGTRQLTFGGGASDAYVAKFSADFSELIYCRFLGGNNTDVAQRM